VSVAKARHRATLVLMRFPGLARSPKTTNVRKLFGDGIVELLERMWDAQPRLRPTMSDVCAELERLIAEARAAARAARRA
jgi:hypothetical protein